MSTKAYMTNRATKALAKEIAIAAENINTWAVNIKELIKLRRKLLKKPKADADLYTIADAFSRLFYKGHTKAVDYHVDSDSSESEDPGSDADSDADSDAGLDSESEPETRDISKHRKHRKTQETEKDVDVDEFLREVVAAEQNAKEGLKPDPKKMTKMQQAAYKVLAEEDREVKDMDDLMSKRRKQMLKDMRNPPVAPVKFTLDVDKTLDSKTGKPIPECLPREDNLTDSEASGEIIDECDVSESESDAGSDKDATMKNTLVNENAKHPSVLELENALRDAMANITADATMHPLIAMQKESPLFAGLPGYDTAADSQANDLLKSFGVTQTTTNTNTIKSKHITESDASACSTRAPPNATKFNTPDVPEFDPKYGPLYRMTPKERSEMQQKWFKQAIVNVDAQLQAKKQPTSPNSRNRLIREETTRIQETFLETYK